MRMYEEASMHTRDLLRGNRGGVGAVELTVAERIPATERYRFQRYSKSQSSAARP
jgi:hypothetical protein